MMFWPASSVISRAEDRSEGFHGLSFTLAPHTSKSSEGNDLPIRLKALSEYQQICEIAPRFETDPCGVQEPTTTELGVTRKAARDGFASGLGLLHLKPSWQWAIGPTETLSVVFESSLSCKLLAIIRDPKQGTYRDKAWDKGQVQRQRRDKTQS
ncbi:hypothetical protein RRG08_016203 [Elysia crispata]|uniref:Uncharacterized protein n=1 Tax=Elysia crispata TaxID=231223 RepID=A0AAE1DJK0_9GAST|nr:hypothetical protein RRG08_016203 [Elysia crispata]